MISVEVCYALPDIQKIVEVQVAEGSSPLQAAKQSQICQYFPELDLDASDMGVFGKSVDANSYELREGDRVEIYRPLIADPKEVRKARAAKRKV